MLAARNASEVETPKRLGKTNAVKPASICPELSSTLSKSQNVPTQSKIFSVACVLKDCG